MEEEVYRQTLATNVPVSFKMKVEILTAYKYHLLYKKSEKN